MKTNFLEIASTSGDACFNDDLTIDSVVLKTRRHVDEVLVVDNGSSDDTKKEGQGRCGAGNGFDTLVLLDGDGQHDRAQIPQL